MNTKNCVIDCMHEYAIYNINDDAFHYRIDVKIDGKLQTLSYVFRGEDPTSFDEVRNAFIEYLKNLASNAQIVEKPRAYSDLPFADLEKMRKRYPS